MSVQLTPGQRCLLDLLQRKLLNTIQNYAKLSVEKQESGYRPDIESELLRLKEKIRRISARQKRFTLEIINGNGNNTIPKETFFEALGLVTKEALSKLNSKTNERRRRTTANPRFSHEAIQAKRALEPLQKRLEPRVSRDKRETASKRAPRNQPNNNNNNSNNTVATNNNINHDNDSINRISGNTNNVNNKNNSSIGKANIQQSMNNINNNTTTNNSNSNSNNNNNATRSSSRNAAASSRERELMKKQISTFGYLKKEVNAKREHVNKKRLSNLKLEKFNEEIRRRGLGIINALANLKQGNNDVHEDNQISQQQPVSMLFNNNNNNNNNDNNQSQTNERSSLQSTDPIDVWIDLKCDESIDGID